MPTIRDSRAIATNAQVANILTGSQFEFMRVPSAITIYAAQDGGLTAPVFMDVSFGNAIEGDSVALPEVADDQSGPNVNQHQLIAGVAAAGDRLVIRMRNTSATTANVRTLVKITPLA